MPLSASARAILDALCFDGRAAKLTALDEDALDFADRAQLTPLLARFGIPQAVAALERNTIRVERVAAAYAEMESAFDHAVLKGFTHAPDFIDDLRYRVQYDLDLYVPAAERGKACDALRALRYEPIEELEGLAMDHLPTMIRKTNWEWRGDYFDPDIPISVEVHFQFWDAATERLRPEGLDQFWTRRKGHSLHPIDKLGYAALHLTRHLLRGNLRVFHVWEIARFLHTQRDPEFWRTWRAWHSPSLRRLEAVAFLLARSWFACTVPPEVEEEIAALPARTRRWFEIYQWSPIEPEPNKRELWLHLSLTETSADRLAVLRRRMLPFSLPGPVDAVHIQDDRMTLSRRAKKQARYVSYAAGRAFFHARLLIPTLWEGLRWYRSVRE